MKTNWIRVTRRQLCLICGRPDWCLRAADGSAAICQREQSDRPVGSKGAGWLHVLRDDAPRSTWRLPIPASKPATPKPQRDWSALAERYQRAMTADGYRVLANTLGLSVASLQLLGVGWDGSRSCWTIPMRNANGDCVGIRTRGIDNDKRSVFGSDGNGLFFAPGQLSNDSLIICEGPSDAAALVDCGFASTVGRPSCKLGNQYIVAILKRLRPKALLLIPDNDQAGLSGFSALANDIIQANAIPLIRLDALTPPKGTNDIRDWAQKNRKHLAGQVAGKLDQIKRRSGGPSND